MKCSRCKGEVKKDTGGKYSGGVYCQKCIRIIKDGIHDGKLTNYQIHSPAR